MIILLLVLILLVVLFGKDFVLALIGLVAGFTWGVLKWVLAFGALVLVISLAKGGI